MKTRSRKPVDRELGGKFRTLSSAARPNGRWHRKENEAACMGNALSLKASMGMHVPGRCSQCWFRDIELQTTEGPSFAATDDYPAMRGTPSGVYGGDSLVASGQLITGPGGAPLTPNRRAGRRSDGARLAKSSICPEWSAVEP